MLEVIAIDHRFFTRYRWGIVDASQRDDLPDHWPMHVIAPSFLGKDTGRCPLLLDLQALPEEDRYNLLDRLAADIDAPLSLALESDVRPERLLAHLVKRLVVSGAAGETERQFRYYDPGTFLQLRAILGEAGMRWLLGPVTAVAVPWCGEWCRYQRPAGSDTAPFHLTDCLPDLLRLSAVNRVLVRLPIDTQESWCNKAALTGQHIARGEGHGLSARDDLVAFALHAWQHHPRFDEHANIRRLLKQLADSLPEDEIDYRELTARLDDAEWQRIVQDLNPTHQGKSA